MRDRWYINDQLFLTFFNCCNFFLEGRSIITDAWLIYVKKMRHWRPINFNCINIFLEGRSIITDVWTIDDQPMRDRWYIDDQLFLTFFNCFNFILEGRSIITDAWPIYVQPMRHRRPIVFNCINIFFRREINNN